MLVALQPSLIVVLHYTLTAAVMWRVLLRDNLLPTVRLAWVMVVALLPLVGPVAYLLFGEVRVRRAARRHARDVERRLRAVWANEATPDPVPAAYRPAFDMAQVTGRFPAVAGNHATLLAEDDAAMEDILAAIDAATDHVHVQFYIWLADRTGTRMAEAMMAAARRGVTARVIVDDVGSRPLLRSGLWPAMQAAGVRCTVALPVGNPLVEMLYQRVDLRNHRKIVVVDNALAWTGSRNCADQDFLPKSRFAPWVDLFLRIEGPVVRQFQEVFLHDWMIHTREDLGSLLTSASADLPDGFIGQVVASGPDQTTSGMSETFCALLYSARREVSISTPYFLPDPALHEAICAAALRGVTTRVILPERNDNPIIAAASEGLFLSLLRSGVRLHLFRPGLLHAKILTVDGRVAMIGSANLDRRSFDLNYECNLLLHSARSTGELDQRQASYVARSREVTLAEVARWSVFRRIRNNAVALAGPLL